MTNDNSVHHNETIYQAKRSMAQIVGRDITGGTGISQGAKGGWPAWAVVVIVLSLLAALGMLGLALADRVTWTVAVAVSVPLIGLAGIVAQAAR